MSRGRVVRVLCFLPGPPLCVQLASTNTYPGFTVSSMLTVLVAPAAVGFHWNVATPSVPVVAFRGVAGVGGGGVTHVYEPLSVETEAVNSQPAAGRYPFPSALSTYFVIETDDWQSEVASCFNAAARSSNFSTS